ncbi:MAG: hypothetical protein KH297_09970 [Firmicutes bacterium]|nr:hypothetical protein [Bacillota bacterium]
MGIIADVNLLTENGIEYIEIVVSPWAFPVNYDGEYHYRSGSTKQQLRSSVLTIFLISKTGMKRDATVVSNITVDDLDKEIFDIFRREVLHSGRMTKDDLKAVSFCIKMKYEKHGSPLLMADCVINCIYLKCRKATVPYHKETRIETYIFARDAVRKAVYNALIYCN